MNAVRLPKNGPSQQSQQGTPCSSHSRHMLSILAEAKLSCPQRTQAALPRSCGRLPNGPRQHSSRVRHARVSQGIFFRSWQKLSWAVKSLAPARRASKAARWQAFDLQSCQPQRLLTASRFRSNTSPERSNRTQRRALRPGIPQRLQCAKTCIATVRSR